MHKVGKNKLEEMLLKHPVSNTTQCGNDHRRIGNIVEEEKLKFDSMRFTFTFPPSAFWRPIPDLEFQVCVKIECETVT